MNRKISVILLLMLIVGTSYGFSQEVGVDSVTIEENEIVKFYLNRFQRTFDENEILNDELSTKVTVITGLRDRITELESNEEDIQDLNDELTILNGTIDGKDTKIESLESTIEDNNKSIASLNATITDLESNTGGTQSLNDRIAELESTIEDNNTLIDSLNATIIELKSNEEDVPEKEDNSDMISELEGTIDILEGNIEDLSNENSSLKEEIADLKVSDPVPDNSDELESKDEEIEQLNNSIKSKDEEIEQLNQSLESKDEEIGILKATMLNEDKVELIVSGLEKSLEDALDNVSYYRDKYYNENDEVGDLENEVEDLEDEINELEEELEEERDKREELEKGYQDRDISVINASDDYTKMEVYMIKVAKKLELMERTKSWRKEIIDLSIFGIKLKDWVNYDNSILPYRYNYNIEVFYGEDMLVDYVTIERKGE